MVNTGPTEDELLALAGKLFDTWDAPRPDGLNLRLRDRRPHVGRFASVQGLAAHTHRCADSALLLMSRGMHLQAMPLVRLSFECAVTAQWVVHADDGAEALLKESLRQRTLTAKEYLDAGPEHIRQAGEAMLAQDHEDQRTSSTSQGRRFDLLCEDLVGGGELYAYYRTMSAFCHAGAQLIDEYLQPTEDRTNITGFLLEPRFNSNRGAAWTFMVVWAMVLAGRAFDFIDADHTRRSQLQAAEHVLGGVPSVLQLTPKAGARIRMDLLAAKRARRT